MSFSLHRAVLARLVRVVKYRCCKQVRGARESPSPSGSNSVIVPHTRTWKQIYLQAAKFCQSWLFLPPFLFHSKHTTHNENPFITFS